MILIQGGGSVRVDSPLEPQASAHSTPGEAQSQGRGHGDAGHGAQGTGAQGQGEETQKP